MCNERLCDPSCSSFLYIIPVLGRWSEHRNLGAPQPGCTPHSTTRVRKARWERGTLPQACDAAPSSSDQYDRLIA